MLSTRAISRGDVVISQWLVEWLNLPQDKAIWEDASFIQTTFLIFYWNTLHSWFPEKYPRGQGSSQGGIVRHISSEQPEEDHFISEAEDEGSVIGRLELKHTVSWHLTVQTSSSFPFHFRLLFFRHFIFRQEPVSSGL